MRTSAKSLTGCYRPRPSVPSSPPTSKCRSRWPITTNWTQPKPIPMKPIRSPTGLQAKPSALILSTRRNNLSLKPKPQGSPKPQKPKPKDDSPEKVPSLQEKRDLAAQNKQKFHQLAGSPYLSPQAASPALGL